MVPGVERMIYLTIVLLKVKRLLGQIVRVNLIWKKIVSEYMKNMMCTLSSPIVFTHTNYWYVWILRCRCLHTYIMKQNEYLFILCELWMQSAVHNSYKKIIYKPVLQVDLSIVVIVTLRVLIRLEAVGSVLILIPAWDLLILTQKTPIFEKLNKIDIMRAKCRFKYSACCNRYFYFFQDKFWNLRVDFWTHITTLNGINMLLVI